MSAIAAAWEVYLERERPFTSSAYEEPAAEVAVKRAFFAGAEAALRAVVFPAVRGARDRGEELELLRLDAELADFAREAAEGRA